MCNNNKPEADNNILMLLSTSKFRPSKQDKIVYFSLYSRTFNAIAAKLNFYFHSVQECITLFIHNIICKSFKG